jgi:hypothetical protein
MEANQRRSYRTTSRSSLTSVDGPTGISGQTLELHYKLYEGYVHNTSVLTNKIAEILREGKIDPGEIPAYSELTRRLGFEYNGMVLHEYDFGNLSRNGDGDPGRGSAFHRAAGPASATAIFRRQTSSGSGRCVA